VLISHIDGRQNVQQLFNAIWNIWKCIIKSTWVINYAKIAKHGQNLRFHFLVEKWLSLGEFLRKKNPKSWKHVFYTNWTILSRKKFFFKKIFLDHSKFSKNRGGHISWTAKALWLIFSGYVVLKYVFRYPKNHFHQTCSFSVMIHSIWPKNAKIASIRVTPGSIFPEPEFCRTCGFRRHLEEGWFFRFLQ